MNQQQYKNYIFVTDLIARKREKKNVFETLGG
jgi:hypothetical protein